jgi:hypothetical protein
MRAGARWGGGGDNTGEFRAKRVLGHGFSQILHPKPPCHCPRLPWENRCLSTIFTAPTTTGLDQVIEQQKIEGVKK